MVNFTPIFSKIVDSSLWGESDLVVRVFITMLAKKDVDNVVRGSAYNIACWARRTEGEVMEALKVLSSPDTKRLEPQAYEGRRIEKVEGGWLMLNGKFYQDEMRKVFRRAQQAEWARNNRLKRGTPLAGEILNEREIKAGRREVDGRDSVGGVDNL